MIDISHLTKEYKVNKQGYRTKEFSQINWNNSYVMLGCSQTFGEGLLENNDTISANLEKLLKYDVINLGIPGAGIDITLYNILELFKKDIKPKGIFIFWPSPYRYCILGNKAVQLFNPPEKDYDIKNADSTFYKNLYNAIAIKMLIENKKIPFVNLNRWEEIKEIYPVNLYKKDVIDWVTPPTGHIGPKTTLKLAKKIYNELQNIY